MSRLDELVNHPASFRCQMTAINAMDASLKSTDRYKNSSAIANKCTKWIHDAIVVALRSAKSLDSGDISYIIRILQDKERSSLADA